MELSNTTHVSEMSHTLSMVRQTRAYCVLALKGMNFSANQILSLKVIKADGDVTRPSITVRFRCAAETTFEWLVVVHNNIESTVPRTAIGSRVC